MASKKEYIKWLIGLKKQIQLGQLQTALKVNVDRLLLNWYLGKQISIKIDQQGWGSNVIVQLSNDLQNAFPESDGFSTRNLEYMRQFALAYPELLIAQQPAALIENIKKNKVTTKAQQPAALIQNNKKNSSITKAQQPAALIGENYFTITNNDILSIPWGHHMLLLDKVQYAEERTWYIQKQ